MSLAKLPLRSAVTADNLMYLSGQLAFDRDGRLVGDDIESQTRQTLINISKVLADNGASLADVVKINVWLTEKTDFPGFNKIYAAFFEDGSFPARSTVVSELLVEGARIEIDAVAILGAAHKR